MRNSFFDCNCAIGPAVTPEVYPYRSGTLPDTDPPHWSARSLIGEMDHFGISAALVYHKLAEIHHPRVGNARLMEEVAPFRDRLYPCWVVLPHHTREMPEPEKLIEQMDSSAVRAVRLYPWVHNFSLREWSCGPLFEALERRRAPVFFDLPFPAPRNWADELLDVCQRHPQLNVVLSGRAHWELRTVYRIMEMLPNLYLDIGWLAACRRETTSPQAGLMVNWFPA